jgi:hypothetical protein
MDLMLTWTDMDLMLTQNQVRILSEYIDNVDNHIQKCRYFVH